MNGQLPVGYPKQMVHPDYAPAVLSFGDINSPPGRPARYPGITVNNPDQEERERSRGYLAAGEARPIADAYREYPMMLSHPHYEPEIPSYPEGKEEDGKLVTWIVPGKPGKFPPVIVNTPAEAEPWKAKGYSPAGLVDNQAFDRAKAGVEADYVGSEWPKMVDGKVVGDPARPPPGPTEYPKYLAGLDIIVASREEEDEALAKIGRGSSKNEPVLPPPPPPAAEPPGLSEADLAAFREWQTAKAAVSDRLARPRVARKPRVAKAKKTVDPALSAAARERWALRRERAAQQQADGIAAAGE